MSPKIKNLWLDWEFYGCLICAVILHSGEVLKSLNLKLSDGLYSGRTISDEIVIVKIDNKSFEEVENGGIGAMKNWNSSTYAKVLEEIEKCSQKLLCTTCYLPPNLMELIVRKFLI